MRRYLLSIALSGLLAGSAAASVVGVADSTGPFSLEREGEVLRSSLGSAAVRPGDTVVAGQHPIKVQRMDGSTVLLARNSSLAVGEDSMELTKGSMVVHPAAGESTALKVDTMTVTPGTGDDAPRLMAVERVGADKFRVRQVGGSYTVTGSDDAPASTVAASGANVTEFLRDENGWVRVPSQDGGTVDAGGLGPVNTTGGDLQAVSYFDFPSDDDLEISTSGEDVGGRSLVEQNLPNTPEMGWTSPIQGGRD